MKVISSGLRASLGRLGFFGIFPSQGRILTTVPSPVLAGRRAHHNASTVAGAACAAVAPAVWLGLNLKAIPLISGSVAWFQPLTMFVLFSASAPLIGAAFGWTLSSLKLPLTPHGV
jgi:hypothetical protein